MPITLLRHSLALLAVVVVVTAICVVGALSIGAPPAVIATVLLVAGMGAGGTFATGAMAFLEMRHDGLRDSIGRHLRSTLPDDGAYVRAVPD